MKNAFETWLAEVSGNNAALAARILMKLLVDNPSDDNLVWKLCDQTGDEKYTQETFLKAAKNCLDKPNNPEVKRIAKWVKM